MKEIDASDCLAHILICTNERPAPRTGCKDFGGMEFYTKFKQKLKETRLSGTHWATRTGCLGFCNDTGTAVVIRKRDQEPKWYSDVTADDFDRIWKEATT